METPWESKLATLLSDLLAVQDELLELLTRKRELLVAADTAGLAQLAPQEERLIADLQQCVRRREELLEQAAGEGLPSKNIRALTKALPRSGRGRLDESVKLASSRARLLQHHALTNWVVVQRTLIHLSQMLEIIATGGQMKPTYGKGDSSSASGALVDRAA